MQPSDETARHLRHEVGTLRARESRRIFDMTLNVGELGADRDSFVLRAQDVPAMDIGLRIDVVSSLVGQTSPESVCAWVTRRGTPYPHDVDLEWLSATIVAFGIHGRELAGFYAITRSGWLDVRTGDRRTWKRLRL